MPQIERIDLAPGLNVPRVLTGLWQVADMERGGVELDRNAASDALVAYARAGFDGFDMADHYGSAELIAAQANKKLKARAGEGSARFFTKWCPQPHEFTVEAVRKGIQARLDRLGVDCIDLLQLHWWVFEHPGYIDVLDELMVMKSEGKIAALGVTNFDADHLHLLCAEGYEIATNQVSFSLVDRRAAGELAQTCAVHGVNLLAYGTLCGGFLSSRWLGMPEPHDIPDWSKMKYKRFIDAAGGWAPFQGLLRALDEVAKRHNVSVSNVATRWVLDHAHVGATIVGARITEGEHRADTADLFQFALNEADRETLERAYAKMDQLPGDCGDEYRRPPFLTASGDLSHHLDSISPLFKAEECRPNRWRISSGSVWEGVCGFSRAIRVGDRILISGTTATHGAGREICKGDVRGQTVYCLDKIAASLSAFGASLDDVVRTRIYMKDCTRWEEASYVHGRFFGDVRPANTLIEIADLVGDYDVEIEAEAIVG